MHKKLDPKEELQVNDYLEFQQPSKGQLTPMGGSLKSYEGQLQVLDPSKWDKDLIDFSADAADHYDEAARSENDHSDHQETQFVGQLRQGAKIL